MSENDCLRIHLSLVSHTNIGKTTLARTLLLRDVGEVADRAHVTENTEDYVLARNNEGCELVLWDTPGFGNSVMLAKRLEGRSNPIGWFVAEIWDRVTNRSLWLNQKSIAHIRDTSSVVLYLVNASESPDATPYISAEMRILAWIGKPVIVLLNQTGAPRPDDGEPDEIAQWMEAAQQWPVVHAVLPMDAFARCWVQEFALFETIGEVIPEAEQPAYEALREVWSRKRRGSYTTSMQAMSHFLETVAKDKEKAEAPGFIDQFKIISHRLGILKDDDFEAPTSAAQAALSAREADAFCMLTDELIHANGLKGKGVRKELLKRVQSDWDVKNEMVPAQAAVAGAIGTGAVSGLAADIAAGGITLGMGALIGSVIGAVGGAGAALVYNKQQDASGACVSWSDPALRNFFVEA
ncbi:MAG: DUF3482 domain-containing protein, partial [Duodenibacillus sp.]|nr:DUF3482 domain-containing protein [Duodenibacillus sp.]